MNLYSRQNILLQIRARSEFSVTGPWSEPLVQSITVEGKKNIKQLTPITVSVPWNCSCTAMVDIF